MKLSPTIWPKFHIFLKFEKHLSQKSSALSADRSRFNKLIDYFSVHDFTRENFLLFLSEMEANKDSYKNKFITMAKYIDEYTGAGIFVKKFAYFDEPKGPIKDILSPDDIAKLADVVIPYKRQAQLINQRQQALVRFMGTTGCRIGEALDLTWNDIVVTNSYYSVTFRKTKNGDDRQIAVAKSIYDLLIALPHLDEHVFLSYRGGKLEGQQINLDLKRRASAVGITINVHNHLFRTSFITTMLENWEHDYDVSVMVGHRSPATTLRYKNSRMEHYSEMIHANPLLKEEITFDMKIKRTLAQLKKIYKDGQFNLRTNEKDGTMSIEIKT